MKENEEIAGHHPSDGRIQATHPTHPTPIQQLQHQQTELAIAVESSNIDSNDNDSSDKNQTTAIIVDVSKTIYRLGHSDTFACHNCKNKSDKWFMQAHNCNVKK